MAEAKGEDSPTVPFLPTHLSAKVEQVRHTQIPLYGTIAGEPPPSDKLGWFQRGYVIVLLQELGSLYGAYILLVFTMVSAPFLVTMDKYFPCQMKEKYVQTLRGSIVCEYTKTYVWSFPQLALASLLLLIGRDFVQKRFYYFMLKNGGVLSFMRRPLLRDTVVVINIWVFAHFAGFCLLVALRLYSHGIDPKKAAEAVVKATIDAASNPYGPASQRHIPLKEPDDPEGLELLIHMLIFLGLPGVLFIAKLVAAYDIEKTLVPLSEYIRDTTTGTLSMHTPRTDDAEAESDTESPSHSLLGATDLAKLVSMKDTSVQGLLEVHAETLLQSRGKDDKRNRYEQVLEVYEREGWYKLAKEPPRIQLMNGLWPAAFLTASRPSLENSDEPAKEWTFNAVWSTYRSIVLAICGLILLEQMVGIIIDTTRCFTEHWPAVFSIIGEIVNIYFVGKITQSFYYAVPASGHPSSKIRSCCCCGW